MAGHRLSIRGERLASHRIIGDAPHSTFWLARYVRARRSGSNGCLVSTQGITRIAALVRVSRPHRRGRYNSFGYRARGLAPSLSPSRTAVSTSDSPLAWSRFALESGSFAAHDRRLNYSDRR